MEETLSSSDSDSDELSKEVECELYSVLHHNDFSQGVPPELLEKYNISCNSNGEFAISLKKNREPTKSSELSEGELTPGDSRASSPDDVVIIDSDSLKNNRADFNRTEQVVVEYSDDSSVEMIQVSRKRKLSDSIISLTSSSTNDENQLSLNTTEVYDSDGNISDVVQRSNFKWEHVASPSTWTMEMRKYYNNPCNRLRHFNHMKIRQELRNGNRGGWFISSLDRFPMHRPQRRCAFCRQVDHIDNDCPKLVPTCHMCGTEGHSSRGCPDRMCLQCGQMNNKFSSSCGKCHFMRSRECFKCKQFGHESKMCPEKWREFHSATPIHKTPVASRSHRTSLKCCNCGSGDHSYEQCKQDKFVSSSQIVGKKAFKRSKKMVDGKKNRKKKSKKRQKALNTGHFSNNRR